VKGGKKMKKKKTILMGGVSIAIAVALLLPVMIQAGSLEPGGAPAPTMKTLDEIPPTWSQKITLATDRFELVLNDEAVLDKETGLVWEQSPSTTMYTWTPAYDYCYALEVAGRNGWHLPTIEQLASLLDSNAAGAPKLPSGHPFSNVQSFNYWSASTYVGDYVYAMIVRFDIGSVHSNHKNGSNNHVWCVRGGQSHDAY
jgi:hypothetical protein